MEIPEELRCLFSARIEEQDGSYVVEIPEEEIQLGDVRERTTYRVAVLPSPSDSDSDSDSDGGRTASKPKRRGEPPEPPVEEGEVREVDIEDIGEQGDGITRVERGFVVIVPDTEQGERVTVEITEVRQNVAFADVVERNGHFH